MPKRVAVVGASTDRRKYGNRAVRAFQSQGYEVLPVNPHHETIEGLRSYRSVLDIPGSIDMATVYVPPEIGQPLLEQFEQKGIHEVWFNPGSESEAIMAEGTRRGLNLVLACSVMGIGRSPEDF
jgi:predicted CoA-binding protein